MMQHFSNEYDYCAFISFNSNDATIANWLKRRLDRFSIPTFIKDKHHISNKHLKPSYTYLHSSEAGNELKEELEKKLIRSRFLIIICSPYSARSAICEWEIETFIKLGRKDYIIPLIIDGIPYSKDEQTECLSPALLKEFPSSPNFHNDKSIKCANLKEKGISWLEQKDHAFAQIISRILNINCDMIWEKVHHKNQIKYASLCVLLSLLLFVGIKLFNYHKTSYDYYLDYADCNGIPCGIMPIEKSEVFDHYGHYRFESKQGKIRRVVYCNSHGNTQEHDNTETKDRPAIIEVGYDSNNGLTITKRDRVGKILHKETISSNRLRADIKLNENNDAATLMGATTAMFMSDNASPQGRDFNLYTFQNNSRSEITIFTYERDSAGYITKTLFKKADGARLVPVPDISGVYGVKYERDSLHRVIKEAYLGKNGRDLVNNHSSISYKTHEYDSYGNISATYYYDKNGNLSTNEIGCSFIRLKAYDKNRILEETYYDQNGNICIALNGLCKKKIYFDKGLIAKIENYTFNDSLTYAWTNTNINWIGGEAISKIKYDEKGQITSISYYDIDDNPCYNDEKIHEKRIEYNEIGDIISITFYNTLGQQSSHISGHSKVINEYDNNHNLISYRYLGVYNQPVNCYGGHSIKKQVFKDNKVVRQSYYNMLKMPTWNNEIAGAASLEIDYDELGNPRELRFFDINDSLYINYLGFAVCELKYDGYCGRISEYAFYKDAEKQIPCENREGYSRIQFSHYDNGLIKEITIPNDTNIYGVSKAIMEYDSCGQPILAKFYGLDGKLTNNTLIGGAIYKQKYSNRLLAEESLFDKKGKPVINKQLGAHHIKYKYDNHKRLTELTYWDTDTSRMSNNLFYFWKSVYVYNKQNKLVEESTYDIDNKFKNNRSRSAKVTFTYDKQGNEIERKYYNEDNKIAINIFEDYAIRINKFNIHNMPIEEYFLNEKGEPHIPYTKEYHKMKYTYNEYTMCTGYEFYNCEDSLCEVSNFNNFDVAAVDYEYRNGTLPIATRYYDASRNLLREEYMLYDDNKNITAWIGTKIDLWGNRSITCIQTKEGFSSYRDETWKEYEKLLTDCYGIEFN